MPNRIHLYRNFEGSYNTAYRHLNKSEFWMNAKHLPGKGWFLGADETSASSSFSVILPTGVSNGIDRKALFEALSDNYDYSCRCEHDCCGHWQRHVRAVKRVGRNRWKVYLRHTQNV